MAELSLTYLASAATAASGVADVAKRVLVRTGGPIVRDTTIDIINPGGGWAVSGDAMVFSTATEFDTQAQVFLNGVLMFTAENAAADNDVYFVAPPGDIAFETNIDLHDIVQIWKFETTVSG